MSNSKESLSLGLIGGLGVGAAIHYYQELAKDHTARGAELKLVMIHADVTRVLDYAAKGNIDPLAEYLSGLIAHLADAGAQVAAIPSVTPHICEPRLVQISPLPLVSLVDVIVAEIQARKLSRVAILGTRFTVESSIFGRLQDVQVVLPSADEIDRIHAAYIQIVNRGSGTPELYHALRQIAHDLCEREGVEAIILAGTELSLVFHPGNIDFPCIDGARLHLDAIMERLTGDLR